MLDYTDAVNHKTDHAVKNINGCILYFPCLESAKIYVLSAPFGTCWLI